MSGFRVEALPLHTPFTLHAQVATRDSLASWQRVGTLQWTEAGPVVAWDPGCAYVAPLLRVGARASTSREGAGKVIRFGVFVARRCVVVGETFVSAEDLATLRRQVRTADGRGPSKLQGVGPRGYRSGWPRF